MTVDASPKELLVAGLTPLHGWDALDFEGRLDQLLAHLPLQDPLAEARWLQRMAQRVAASVQAHGRPTELADRLAVRRAIAQADLWLETPRREVS